MIYIFLYNLQINYDLYLKIYKKNKFNLNENKAKFSNTSNHKKIIYFYFYIK